MGLWTPSIVLNFKYLENTTFRKLHLFQSSGEARQTSSLLGSLEKANPVTLTTWHSISTNVDTNFTDKRRSLCRYSSFADLSHGIYFSF
jgi:hypothetical protein